MKNYTYAELEAEFTRLGYKWPKFHIIGVRSKANEKNKFDGFGTYKHDMKDRVNELMEQLKKEYPTTLNAQKLYK